MRAWYMLTTHVCMHFYQKVGNLSVNCCFINVSEVTFDGVMPKSLWKF